MTWELYEVWATTDGHDQLIDTTNSLKKAQDLAKSAIDQGAESARIYRELEDGDLEVVEEL